MIRVLLAEDMRVLREALVALLGAERDIEVVAAVARGDEVLAVANRVLPDVAVLDINLPGRHGLAAAAELRAAMPHVPILMLTVLDKPGLVHRALHVIGVHGFMLKADAAMGDLAEGIRRVHRGEFVCNRDLLTRSRAAAENPLTGRERDVVRLAARGLSAVSIAGRLGLAEGTVRNHVTRAKRKLSANTVLELVRKAEPNGWL
jgi:two-component system response regulator DesR